MMTINVSIVLLVVSTAYANVTLGQAGNVTTPPQSVVRHVTSSKISTFALKLSKTR